MNDQIKLKEETIRGVNSYEEANRCLLCQDAPCTKACKSGDPARAIRAIGLTKRIEKKKVVTTAG